MRKKKSLFRLFLCAVIAICFVNIISLQYKNSQLEDSIEDVQELNEKRKNRLNELNEKYNRNIDDEYIINEARERFGYAFPNEIIYENDLNNN